MIPLPKNAVISGEHGNEGIMLRARDKLLLRQYEAGGVDVWKKVTDYGTVENKKQDVDRIEIGDKIRQKEQ